MELETRKKEDKMKINYGKWWFEIERKNNIIWGIELFFVKWKT